MIRVLIADDQVLVRAGFRILIDSDPDLEVVGEAGDGAAAVDLALRYRPDLVLMDIRMPDMDGLEATRRISAEPRLAGTRVLILTTFEIDDYIFEALRSGASGFLLKDTEPEDLLAALRVVHRGDALLAPRVTRRLIEEVTSRSVSPAPTDASLLQKLTDREREVLALVAGGHNNEEIAAELFLSPLTAKTHVSRILTKLGARDRTQLVVMAYETGVVVPGAGRRPGQL